MSAPNSKDTIVLYIFSYLLIYIVLGAMIAYFFPSTSSQLVIVLPLIILVGIVFLTRRINDRSFDYGRGDDTLMDDNFEDDIHRDCIKH